MQTLTKAILCLTFCFFNYSCGQNSKNIEPLQANKTIQLNGKTYTLKEGVVRLNRKPESKIIFHEIYDTQRNMLIGYMPFPSDWGIKKRLDKDGVNMSAPNNVKVYGSQSNYFSYSQLPGMNQMMAEKGWQIKPIKSVESLVEDELKPMFRKGGVNLVKAYHSADLQKYDENYDQFVFKSVPMRKEFKTYVTEWEDGNGSSLLFVIRYSIAYSQTGVVWGYYANIMDAPKSSFESAKKHYLYALGHAKYNPQWLHRCYMEEAQKARQRNEIHDKRMAMLRAEGEAIVQRGKAHSAMVDRNHKRFMDSHLERQTISAGSTNYQVDAGSNVYWVNSNGEYIPTNDFNFDPNLDPNLNSQTWTKGNMNN